MTRPLPFTQASLKRAINAARKAGLRVTGIKPDGTLVVNDGDNSPGAVAGAWDDRNTAEVSKWGDVQA
jgi:hypothetical protein